jgi:hypothetical protein
MLSCLRLCVAASVAAATTASLTAAAAADRRPTADYVCEDLVLTGTGFARGTTACKAEKGGRSSGDIHGTFTVHGFVHERAKPVTVTCKPDPDLPRDPSGAFVREVFGYHCS